MDSNSKVTAAKSMLNQMPLTLKNSVLENNECSIPLPQYDSEGVFKNYMPHRTMKDMVSP